MSEFPVVVAARRTPITVKGGGLAHRTAAELAAPVIRACLDDAGSAGPVGDVVLGNTMGPGGNIARVAALAAGLGVEVPGMTIDRQCGSGLAAIITAAEAVRAGDGRLRIAGGVESCSTAPTRIADGVAYRRAPFAPPGHADPDMVRAAQDLAVLDGIGRERQDAYAARSHRLAVATRERGGFAGEIVPVAGVTVDSGPRARVPALLDRFPPLFPDAGGTLTAGNSCRDSDGAAAVAIVPAGVPGLAIIATATVGCDPALPGLGPVAAVETLLKNAGRDLAEVAAIELVEAFAAQALASLTRLGLAADDDVDPRVCADGGALALGHPWGASAAVSVVRLFSRLVRAGAPAGTLGLATAAVGGGLGVAALFEVVR
ncbi:acetyl-CoA C-acetyltransferase [Asanoa ferruginea]|uniref:Acetyl-CoA C-acetyltransferase n=1 Tax=Asanoa ferruginea TaxID=53367 RepID=A0A3D9ZCY7_9ACTN|nr:thiolase family protein [Asanoa ferruginea]REF95278.1 acetyl-CoA C-acetyltransferase [Asanoa ferruginea]GIF48367.1 acetyl-CoA acetyltransferase [Asanoa ferruginea]